MNSLSGAIVVGGYANGLTTVRALAALGLPITVIATRSTDIAQYSKWATESVYLERFHSDPECLVDLLERRSSIWRNRIVFPTNDHALEVLSINLERLTRQYVIPVPPWDSTRILLDKCETARLASRLGIQQPKSYGRTGDLNNEQLHFGFPVVVKPRHGHLFYERFRKKLFFARSRLELDRCLERLEQVGLEGTVQEWIPGGDNCFFNYSVYIDRDGNPLGEFPMHKLRKSPPFFGVCRVSETCEASDLRAPTLEFLRAAGWRGMANAEFKKDPRDGSYKLMEINGRCFLMQGLPLRAGINYPGMALAECGFGDTLPKQGSGWQGFWIHLHADIVYGLLSWRREGIGLKEYLKPYLKSRTFAVWSLRDPKPFLVQWLKTAQAVSEFSEYRTSLLGGIERLPAPDREAHSLSWSSGKREGGL